MQFLSRAALALALGTAMLAPASANEPASRQPEQAAPTSAAQPVAPVLSAHQSAIADRLSRLKIAGSAHERAERQALLAFYAARGHAPVWTSDTGMLPRALAAVGELARADEWGLSAVQLGAPELQDLTTTADPAALADAEVGLGLAVLAYARHAKGGRIEPAAISEFIDRKPSLPDPKIVLDEIAATPAPDAYLRSLHPRHAEFERLSQLALALKAALAQPATEASEPVQKGRKQRRAVERPESAQLRKVLASMEQWRWMPADLGKLHVIVNVPEFTMRVMKDGKPIHAERVIVGKTDTPTPVFSNAMQTVVFQPNWYIPPSIKEDEIGPALERGSNVLERRGLKVQRGGRDVDASRIDWGNVDLRNFVFYQPSGPANALGQVKFLFPNRHDVYMHDTPSKSLFNASVRTFSHGCVRVRNPLKLAEVVMGEDKSWGANQIEELVKTGPQNNAVALDRKIPVHITYFTASTDQDGKANYSSDIYGHDARIAQALKGQPLVAQVRTKAKPPAVAAASRPAKPRVAQYVERPALQPAPASKPSKPSDRNWARNALNNSF